MKEKVHRVAFEVKSLYFPGPIHYPIVLKFKEVHINHGDAYDSRTGVFTAPFDGLYSFYFFTLSSETQYPLPSLYSSLFQASNYEGLTLHVFLAKDRTRFMDVVCSAKSRVCSGETMIKLKKGDEISSVLAQNKIIDGYKTKFSGYLVYQIFDEKKDDGENGEETTPTTTTTPVTTTRVPQNGDGVQPPVDNLKFGFGVFG